MVRASSLPRLPNWVNRMSAVPESRVARVPPKKHPMLPALAATVISDSRPATELLYARMMPAQQPPQISDGTCEVHNVNRPSAQVHTD